MSTIRNKTCAMPNRYPGAFLKATQVLLLIVLVGGLLFAIPAFAQGSEAANPKTGGILGTVADVNSDPIPNATVIRWSFGRPGCPSARIQQMGFGRAYAFGIDRAWEPRRSAKTFG